MDNLGEEHDLLSYVNSWEQKSVWKIQAAAEQARIDVRKYLNHNKQQLKTYLDQVINEAKPNHQSNNYTEIDLKKWIKQMQEIRELLEKPSSIRIIDRDDTQSIIHLIQVKETETTNGAAISSKEAIIELDRVGDLELGKVYLLILIY
jgi:hypothetical protein